jgi:hypothetical protein
MAGTHRKAIREIKRRDTSGVPIKREKMAIWTIALSFPATNVAPRTQQARKIAALAFSDRAATRQFPLTDFPISLPRLRQFAGQMVARATFRNNR